MTTYKLINYKIKSNCIAFIEALDHEKEWQVDIKPYKNNRSISQNRLMWLWLKEISLQLYDAGGELIPDTRYHLFFKQKFLGMKEYIVQGESVWDLGSTKKLNTKEFTEYLEDIELYAGSEWGIRLPHPGDIYYEAMNR